MNPQTDLTNAAELALIRLHLKLADSTAYVRGEATLVCDEMRGLANTYPTLYGNVRRLTATELHAVIGLLEVSASFCSKDAIHAAATVAIMLHDDIAGHYRRLWTEAQHLECLKALYLDQCEICDTHIIHHPDLCDECFIEVMEFDDEDDADDEKWEKNLQLLKEYSETHGDCLVPQNYVTVCGVKLGAWVDRQRVAYWAGKKGDN